MSEVKLEVGQVWSNNNGLDKISITEVIDNDGLEYIKFMAYSIYPMLGQVVRDCYTLHQNADGTPVEKPKKYKELTPVEAMRLLADAGEPIECECRDGVCFDWSESILRGVEFNTEHHFHTEDNVYKCCRIEVTND